MSALFLKFFPIVLLFAGGILLRRLGWATPAAAARMLRLVLNVGLPALILVSVSATPLGADLVLLPIMAALVIVLTWPLSVMVAARLGLSGGVRGVFITGPMIMNLAAEYPFVLIAWGAEGFGRFALFDLGNGLVVMTLTYSLAVFYGGGSGRARHLAGRLMRFPPLWALAVALAMNAAGLQWPGWIETLLKVVGGALVLLVMVALGIYFRLRLPRVGAIGWAIALRVGGGLAVALTGVTLLGIDGLDRQFILFGAMAPVGFNALVFAAREGLDVEFAAALVSVNLLLALVYLPLVLFLIAI